MNWKLVLWDAACVLGLVATSVGVGSWLGHNSERYPPVKQPRRNHALEKR